MVGVNKLRGAFIVNKYYADEGMDYVFSSLKAQFDLLGAELFRCSPSLVYSGTSLELKGLEKADFAIFWDKNVNLAFLVQNSLRMFNSAEAVAICDDKQLSYAKIMAHTNSIKIPKTICAPKMYDNCDNIDQEFLHLLEEELGYPMIAKENSGSQGRQVYLARDKSELSFLYAKLKHQNHHYQQFMGSFGEDLRLYMVAGELRAAYFRKGDGFRSNLYGAVNPIIKVANPDNKTVQIAKEISSYLGLSFGSIDFLIDNDEPIFLEANSNAYFKGAQMLGFEVARAIAQHVIEEMR